MGFCDTECQGLSLCDQYEMFRWWENRYLSLEYTCVAITTLGNGLPNAAQKRPNILTTEKCLHCTQTFKLSTNLRERAAYISHVPHGGLMDVDGGDGDLEAGTQPEQEPAHVELPRLAGRHHHRPPDEQAHH